MYRVCWRKELDMNRLWKLKRVSIALIRCVEMHLRVPRITAGLQHHLHTPSKSLWLNQCVFWRSDGFCMHPEKNRCSYTFLFVCSFFVFLDRGETESQGMKGMKFTEHRWILFYAVHRVFQRNRVGGGGGLITKKITL